MHRLARLHGVHERQVQREGAAFARGAVDPDLAAKEPGDLAADREAQAGTAELSAGAGVALLERLEDDAVLLLRDADAAVADAERHHGVGRVEQLLLGVPSTGGHRRLERDAAPLGELERVRQQVLEHLLQALGVGLERRRQAGLDVHLEVEPLEVGHLPEGALDELPHLGERHRRDVHRHGPGFDLGQVQDVVDQVEQVGAGAVDRLGKADLLGGEVAVRVLAQDLRQDEQAVERRPQLVRHVGQELGLVLGDEGELLGLLLQRHLGLLDLLVLLLHLRLLAGEELGLDLQLRVGRLQLVLLLAQQLLGLLQRAGLLLQPLVGLGERLLLRLQALGEGLALLEQLLGPHIGGDRVEHDADALGELLEEGQADLVELVERGQLEHRLGFALEQNGEHHQAPGWGFAETGAHLDVVVGHLAHGEHPAVLGALAHQPLAHLELGRDLLPVLVGVARQQLEHGGLAGRVDHVEDAVVRGDQRGQVGEDELRHGREVALALEHAAELGQVGLEPVLLHVLAGGVAQVADHLVDVVLELRDFALCLHRDRAGQVALGHRRRHVGDGAHLGGEVGGELIHVAREIAPHAGGAGYPRLAAELPLDAHLAGHVGHLIGERGQGVGHAVDRVGESRDLALHLHAELLLQVAVGDRRHHLGDAAHLRGEVAGHPVHVVGQVLPHAGHADHLRLAAELALGAHLARHAGHFRRERVELVHHRVHGVLELQDLALHVHRDLLVELAAGHGGGDFGDVADLGRQVPRHAVDVIGEVFPGARHALYFRLPAELALGAHLAGDAGHLGGERAELVHHRVHRLADPEELAHQRTALDVERHGLRQVALGHRADDPGHLAGRLHQVSDQGIDRAHRGRPGPSRPRQGGPLRDPPLLAHRQARIPGPSLGSARRYRSACPRSCPPPRSWTSACAPRSHPSGWR